MIEGIPDGWELVRVGVPDSEDWLIGHDGSPVSHAALKRPLKLRQYAIIRKIEKPKRFRPFANAAEAEPFFDRRLRYKSDESVVMRISVLGRNGIEIAKDRHTYEEAFKRFLFDDGTPFGIEVTE